MLQKFVLFYFIFSIFLIGSSLLAAGRLSQIKVFIDGKDDYIRLQAMHPDIIERGDNYFEIISDQTEFSRFERAGYKIEIVHEDVTAFYQSRLDVARDMGGYKTLDEINAYLDTIILNHPDIVSSKISLGQTIEGRDMWAVKISDNPEVDEDEPEILYNAAIHAREVITPEVLFYFMDYLTDNYASDPEVTAMVDEREMWFIPMVNPDGYYRNEVTDPGGGGMWRKNRRNNGDGTYGVDLNRNFGYEWGYDDVGSSPYTNDNTYRGTGPFSEPETQHMRDFIASHDFIVTVCYHSYSNLILYPWGYETIYTPDNDIFTVIGDSVFALNGYDPGTPWELLYTVNGSTDDWGYGEQTIKEKNFAISFEVGTSSDGFWPPLSRIPELVSENLEPNLFLARVAGNIYKLRPPFPPQLIIPDPAESTSYEISWSHNDSINPAIIYELKELQNFTLSGTDNATDFNNWSNSGFSISQYRSHSTPSAFYSGSGNNLIRNVRMLYPRPVKTGDTLRFWTWYEIEGNWDYAYVDISTDGVNFESIAGNITTTYDPYGNNRGHGITGVSSGWIEALFSLDDYAGQSVFLRFSYETDSYIDDEGFYVDDISPIPMYAVENVVSSDITDSFYVFSDKPTGLYYYKVRAQDAENQWGEFSDTEQVNVTAPLFICADVNNDETVNIFDITFLISYLYSGGPPPDYPNSADVNNDGSVNIFDITRIIAWLYSGGTEPDCP